MIRARFLTLAAVAIAVVVAAAAWAGGPKNVNGAGTPLTWGGQPTPIPFNPDLGTLGARTNAQAVSDITSDFNVWAAVTTASLSFSNTGSIGVCANGQGCVAGTLCPDTSTCTAIDVTNNADASNYSNFFGICGDGLSPIIFDTDGTIMTDLFGSGANNSVVAVAHPDCTDLVALSTITEGSAILNGRFLDGVSNGSNPELTLVDYSAVVIREFGHYLNLDNSQINLTEATDDNNANDNAVATMYPFLINGTEQATLNLDDRVSVSALYPAPAFTSSFGKITGSVLLPNKEGAFQGAYVIARLVGDPRISAVGAASGARFFPHNDGGLPNPGLRAFYELPGLPPGDYTVQIEAIDPNFTRAAAVGPLDPPVALPIPELWNGECPPPGTPTPAAGCESNTNPPDDPTQSTIITVTAGGTVSNINFILNGEVTGPANDACTAPAVINPAALPFSATLSTTTATIGIFDPLLSCILTGGADQNTNSVWYSFTPVLNGTVVADTTGSDYDTALAAYTGGCGALTEVACNDDVDDVTVQSQITFPVTGGTTYLIEPTHYFIDTSGGSLHFALAFTPAPSTPTTTPTTTPTRTPTRTPTTPGAPTSTPTNAQPTATTTPTRTVTPTPSATASGTPTATPIPGGFTVGGQIRYYSNALAVQNVEVHVDGGSSSVVNTDATGAYSTTGLAQTNWTFAPQKHGDAGAGISALDASFILQFLVGLRSLSPVQQMACDVSGNGTLSAFDAAFILQSLVGLLPVLPVTQNCASDWAFVPVPAGAANQVLVEPQLAVGSCQHGAIAFQPLVGDASGQDFSAMLFGDCTGNWLPPASATAALSPRQLSSRPSVRLGEVRRGRAGTVRFPLIVESEEAFYALYARIDFDPTKLRLLGARTVGAGRSALLQANTAEAGTLLIALANAQPMAAGSASTVLLEFEPRRAGSAAAPHIHGASVDERSAQ